MSCAKHKYSGLIDGFVHKVVHNLAQSVPNAREVAYRVTAPHPFAGKIAS
mgnify:CR=1 FL=1